MKLTLRATMLALLALAASAGHARAEAVDRPSLAGSATRTVSGVVTTRSDGLPLPGATVTIPSLKLSAVTDARGFYVISIPPEQASEQAVEVQAAASGLQLQATSI